MASFLSCGWQVAAATRVRSGLFPGRNKIGTGALACLPFPDVASRAGEHVPVGLRLFSVGQQQGGVKSERRESWAGQLFSRRASPGRFRGAIGRVQWRPGAAARRCVMRLGRRDSMQRAELPEAAVGWGPWLATAEP